MFVGLAGNASGYAQDPVTQSFQVIADYFEGNLVARDRKQAPDSLEPKIQSMSVLTADGEDALRRILLLHEDGATDIALDELGEFRERYPEHPVSLQLEELGL